MSRRFCVFVLAALLTAVPAGWHMLGAVTAFGQQGKSSGEKARFSAKLPMQPTEAAQPLRQQVQTAMTRAANRGDYACCVEPACSWCLLHLGKCTCVMGVGSGRWACRECHGGWEAGQGRIPGKRKEDVRKMKTLTVEEKRLQTPTAERATPSATTTPSNGRSPDADTPTVAAGEKLYGTLNCQSCHKMAGRGSALGPDLTHEAQRHAEIAWQIAHLQHPDKIHPGSTMPSFAHLKPEELKALAAYLVMQK